MRCLPISALGPNVKSYRGKRIGLAYQITSYLPIYHCLSTRYTHLYCLKRLAKEGWQGAVRTCHQHSSKSISCMLNAWLSSIKLCLNLCRSASFCVDLHQNSTTMIQAIEDINAIIKELAIVRLKAEGGVDGRVAKGIANRIIQVSGERLLKLEHTISEQGKALEEKDVAIAVWIFN